MVGPAQSQNWWIHHGTRLKLLEIHWPLHYILCNSRDSLQSCHKTVDPALCDSLLLSVCSTVRIPDSKEGGGSDIACFLDWCRRIGYCRTHVLQIPAQRKRSLCFCQFFKRALNVGVGFPMSHVEKLVSNLGRGPCGHTALFRWRNELDRIASAQNLVCGG